MFCMDLSAVLVNLFLRDGGPEAIPVQMDLMARNIHADIVRTQADCRDFPLVRLGLIV